jgi:NADH:ubiquinone oxidoreductase subunit E
MEGKYIVTICVGTQCFVQGGHHLRDIMQHLPEDLKGKVKVLASVCLGCDQLSRLPKPPYARVQDKLIEEASIEKIIQEIKQIDN